MLEPEGMLDEKHVESASVNSSESLTEPSVRCTVPHFEGLPQIKDPSSDMSDLLYSNFEEDVPIDYPSERSPLEGCITQAFNNNFNSVLYSSCEDYVNWVAEAADVIQKDGLLKKKVCNYDVCSPESNHRLLMQQV